MYSLNEFQTCEATEKKKLYPPLIPGLVGEMWVGSQGEALFPTLIKNYFQQDLNLRLFQKLVTHPKPIFQTNFAAIVLVGK